MVSGMVMTGSGTGVLGGKDSFGSAKGKMSVGDGSGSIWGVMKDGKAPEDEEGSENFRDGL